MKQLLILVGPPGSGKSTLAKEYEAKGYVRISQDDQGRDEHFKLFIQAVINGQNICIDRMNFDKKQRERYLNEVKAMGGYTIKIIVLHEPQAVCLERMLKREGHPTIKDEKSARAALHTFFSKYQRPTLDEADEVEFRYPDTSNAPHALIYDLDGTVCDISHRQHHVLKVDGKKPNWRAFFSEMDKDKVNQVVADIIIKYHNSPAYRVVACSGRPNDYRSKTLAWLEENFIPYDNLFMRPEGDSRQDYIIKEIILDFELLTQYRPFFVLDDRDQVVKLWRSRGLICLQVAEGNF